MNKPIYMIYVMIFVLAVIMAACAANPAAPNPITVQDGTAPYCVPANPMPTAGVTHLWAEQVMLPSVSFTLTSAELYLRANGPASPSGNMWLEIQGVNGGGNADGIAVANGISNTLNAAAVSTAYFSGIVFTFNNCSITQSQPIAIVFKTGQDWDCSFARLDACPIPSGYVSAGSEFVVNNPTEGVLTRNIALVFLYGYQ